MRKFAISIMFLTTSKLLTEKVYPIICYDGIVCVYNIYTISLVYNMAISYDVIIITRYYQKSAKKIFECCHNIFNSRRQTSWLLSMYLSSKQSFIL